MIVSDPVIVGIVPADSAGEFLDLKGTHVFCAIVGRMIDFREREEDKNDTSSKMCQISTKFGVARPVCNFDNTRTQILDNFSF